MADIVGTVDNDSLSSGADSADGITGLEGDDTLIGSDGDDTLAGGQGDDTYVITESETTWVEQDDGSWLPVWSKDLVVENAGEGIDTILDLNSVGAALGANVENYVGGLGRGNELGNVMTAAAAVDTGWGLRGSDAWLWGDAGDDTLNGRSGNDDLHGDAGNDKLVGNSTPDEIPGASDEDELDGGEGADTMIGGLGIDTYWADDLGDLVIEDAAPAGMDELDSYYSFHWDTVYWTGAGQYTLADNVEFLHLRGLGSDALGNADDNVIYSDKGSYTVILGEEPEGQVRVDGAAGDDTLLGGYGLGDTLSGSEGDDRVEGGGGSDLLSGGVGADLVTGDHYWNERGADTLLGADGDDTLDGTSGNDSVVGGVGNDQLDGGFDNDRVEGGDGEDLVYGSYGDDTIVGGAGSDRIGGGQGVNLALDYVDGEDFILGEAAFEDLVITQDGADTLITHNDEWGGVSSLRLLGIAADQITIDDFLFLRGGSEFDDSISGDGGDDYVEGGDGDDTLDGGGGGDDVNGGGGGDTVDGGNGTDTVSGGSGDDTVGGGGGDDTLDGGAGDDTLDGGTGDDTLGGGGGDDTYVVVDGDTVEEDAGGGTDTVVAGESYKLGDNVEDLVLGDAANGAAGNAMAGYTVSGPQGAPLAAVRLNGTGNALNNRIDGSSGANTLWGKEGADRLAGNDGNDRLSGGEGRDKLYGGDGRDLLVGGGGRDLLYGGRGADTFQFKALADGGDRIVDFSLAQGDVIDLSAMDANANRAGDQAFRFVDAFTGRAGQAVLTYDAGRDRTLVQLDADGDGASDFSLGVNGQLGAAEGWML